MRKYTFIEGHAKFKKAMVANLSDEYCLFLYDTEKDDFAKQSKRFHTIEEVYKYLDTFQIETGEWIEIEDPLEYCNYDLITPTRLVGRDVDKPNTVNLWERYVDGNWHKYLYTDENGWKEIEE
ncbi:hypothetical protein M2475_001414 [Breznakia sp. PF5-3]|uniref:hypothetical protein n=1 Tax=unclassified Breznakia TaxID=2623764 RepID=UPI0024067D65|nr:MULTISPECIES: hypothetical protein [unclassified Breznakia]MDF9824967.1 hypothetical protein [Breznakia sp. PM6-1]MDF9835840.1 hypothetical protein [Breznakia sp. PF5-3]MDF9836908.1 hypothetical protein [Breznakia sp. PFB2-8]MDF9859854.1 hypothetical protein [Breznakia sp. PH5-24]